MDETQLLIKIAKLYYEEQMNFSEIGEIIHVSRFTAARLLKKAKDFGIVEIIIHDQWEQNKDLELHLCEKFSLKHAIVLERRGRSESELVKGLAYLAANYLDQLLQPGWTLGVSWGRTLDNLVTELKPTKKKNIKIVQMMGHAGLSNPKIDGPEIVRRLAEKYGGEYYYLPAPLIVEDHLLKENLIKQPTIEYVMDIASSANILVFGIGELSLQDYSVWAGFLRPDDIIQLKEKGAVGHICGQFIDYDGKLMDIGINKRFIGIGLDEIKHVDWVLCVAGSNKSADVIASSLRGKLYNVLITDDIVAKKIIIEN